MNEIQLLLIDLIAKAGRIKERIMESDSEERDREMSEDATSLFKNEIVVLGDKLWTEGNLEIGYKVGEERDSQHNRELTFNCFSCNAPKFAFNLNVKFRCNGVVTILFSHSFTEAEMAEGEKVDPD